MKSLTRTLITLTCTVLATLGGLRAIADGISGSGVVRYFHSVVIDGVHYQTDHAIIRINGESALEQDLKVGYHVSYRADGEPLQAWSMDYYDTVAGTVDAVTVVDHDMQVGQIRMLNQRIETDADTWFHGVTLDSIVPGMALAISAEWLPGGTLLASSVDAVARSEQVLSGRIDRITGSVLLIGGVSVDAGNVGIELTGERLAVGEWIHALGHFEAAAGGTLYATRLVRQADRDVVDLSSTVEGVLSREGGQWRIRDHAVQIDRQRASIGGATLAPGARVKIAGLLKPSGLLIADQVRVESRSRYRLDGVIDAVHPDGQSISIGGHTVQIDQRASLRDDRDGYRWFGPEDLAVHDAVSLIIEDNDGRLRARKITRQRSSRQVIRARVQKMHWWQGPTLLNQRRASAYQAREAIYDGQRVSPWRLRFLIRRGDAVTLNFDNDGGVARAEVRSTRSGNTGKGRHRR